MAVGWQRLRPPRADCATVGIHRLTTVDAFIAFDFDDAPTSAGGTRLAPDVTEREAELLARAMTYKFAVLGAEMGGAKGAVRTPIEEHDTAMALYCEEIRPLIEARRFLTGPDLGTSEADFAPLRPPGAGAGPMGAMVEGVAMEDLVTGAGVVAAASAAVGGLDGRSIAIEGFGKVGGGVARAAAARGARVVGICTLYGCITDPAGLNVARLWEARAAHGDRFVAELGLSVAPAGALFDLDADVIVPGARTGAIDEKRAAGLRAQAVVPAANVPYTARGSELLRVRGIAAHADFICNAGAVIGYRSPRDSSPEQVMASVDARITALVNEAMEHPGGPFAGACAMAERFLRGWRGDEEMPPGPPLA